MLTVGDRVRLKSDAPLLGDHPVLASAVGIVGCVVKGPQWARLTSSPSEREADVSVHVRFATPVNLVLLNVEADQFERFPAGDR